MPRRSEARTRLLEVARRRFAADGALSATLDEIRREAGVSVGALYHHFPDKVSLMTAVFAELIGEYQDGFVAMLRKHDTAEGGIRGGVAYHLRWVAAHRGEAGLLLGPRLDSDELRAANRRFFAAVADWWRPHHRYGVLQPMDTAITAALWLGPAQEYSRHWLASGARRIPPATIAVFAGAAWKALRANTTEEDENGR
ncbi:bacterial regulatory s, tetR family protein [Mycolicibacterium hassiacum DSM 44199]|uniref:Bacterial regulatory s, tetR family protein n=1 Tax=Mycolicibacterium hassiacum (strain DSM 44199 / CIP 105218 / JCM 12690 / 3849) TaxID=1122247 RepID=K5BJU3_MYCHD|nr:TetR/AcrR family transcriptional regulator [Mycolicibacterium hassiacum]EKF23714.1 bacterial regulatory s, tetR family protein [Mycolicibacterium hassiacum DSM 44199]MBX5487448.1 TetR/AcrR family transcriptional regulator [Mycolicibacterium hassiacum]MDA4085970.1 TetR family transcriptional regulator [Mycolicibacterium hassiacum DSM 44199]PZN19491.1 MAG: TetR/AcrR family transcriptional regulator [Mycolicibacterium hassiacum]VCT90291.1 putative HTH-type transcriptional regulator TtgW [Mycol